MRHKKTLDEKKVIVAEFHRQYSPPYSMDKLTDKLSIEAVKAPLENNTTSGWIERKQENSFRIVVNANHSLQRRCFTLGHELAHYILHEDKIGKEVVDNVLYPLGSQLETEANQYAAEILMPYDDLLKDIITELNEREGPRKTFESGNGKSTLDRFVEKLAGIYNVSSAAMRIRLGTKFGLWTV